MSLIERAAGRIAASGREATKLSAADGISSVAASHQDSAIERAAAKLHERQSESGHGILSPNTGPSHGAPSMLDLQKSRREPTMAQVSPHGMINLARLKQAGMITPDGERSTIAEEFRQIKRPLLMNAFNQGVAQVKNGNLIMVTSSLPR